LHGGSRGFLKAGGQKESQPRTRGGEKRKVRKKSSRICKVVPFSGRGTQAVERMKKGESRRPPQKKPEANLYVAKENCEELWKKKKILRLKERTQQLIHSGSRRKGQGLTRGERPGKESVSEKKKEGHISGKNSATSHHRGPVL